jgi:hypothetical protein
VGKLFRGVLRSSACASLALLAGTGSALGDLIAVTEGARYVVIRDGEVVEPCSTYRGGGVVVAGASRLSDGAAVIAYSLDPIVADTQIDSGVDVLTNGCVIEASARFGTRQFSGLAVGPKDDIWVSDAWTDELLNIDPVAGSVERTLRLAGNVGSLQTIDSGGRFYLLGGNPLGVRILDRQGALVQDVPVGTSFISAVRVGRRGDLWILDGLEVQHLSRAGDLLDAFPASNVGGGFAFDERTGRLWISTMTGEGTPGVLNVTATGQITNLVLADELRDSPPVALALIGAVPSASGSDNGGCQIPARRSESSCGVPYLLIVAVIGWLNARRPWSRRQAGSQCGLDLRSNSALQPTRARGPRG